MKLGSPIESLTHSLMHAGLTNPHDYSVTLFEQTWMSTALGFGGIGGQAITSAYTVVIDYMFTNEYSVYFAGRFAYKVEHPNLAFFEDVAKQNMSPVHGHQERYGRTI